MLADTIIFNRIGGNLKAARLKQNITQPSLADAADIFTFLSEEKRERRDWLV